MIKTTRIFAVAAVAALIAVNANATPFNPVLDEFWIIKNSTEIFRDSFNDGVVPPSGPDSLVSDTYFVEGPAGMASETTGTEAEGKLTMDPSLGNAVLNPEGNTNIRTAARRLLSRNTSDPNFLGYSDSFSVNGLFDLSSLPDVPASGFGVRIEDRGTGNPTAGNDMVLLEVARSRNSGQLLILFQDVNFETGIDDIMDFVPLQPILDALVTGGTPAVQVQLSITKAAGTDVIDGFFTLLDLNGLILGAAERPLDNVGNTSGNTIGIYDGEEFTRAAFQARTQVVPEPAILTLMSLGLAGIGYKRHRSKQAA